MLVDIDRYDKNVVDETKKFKVIYLRKDFVVCMNFFFIVAWLRLSLCGVLELTVVFLRIIIRFS